MFQGIAVITSLTASVSTRESICYFNTTRPSNHSACSSANSFPSITGSVQLPFIIYGLTVQVGWLGLRVGGHLGAESAFIKWTDGWTLVMALPWREHHQYHLGYYYYYMKVSCMSLQWWNINSVLQSRGGFNLITQAEAVLAIRPGRPWTTQTRAWPTQTKFWPTYTTPVGLPKICLAPRLAYPNENS